MKVTTAFVASPVSLAFRPLIVSGRWVMVLLWATACFGCSTAQVRPANPVAKRPVKEMTKPPAPGKEGEQRPPANHSEHGEHATTPPTGDLLR